MYRYVVLAVIVSAFALATCKNDDTFVDRDGDHYDNVVDCNDDDPSIHPGAPEVCDGIDNDCDDGADEETDLRNDADNCGSCGYVCPAVAHAAVHCSNGECGFSCLPGFADCDGEPANGCECMGTCASGYADCDRDAENGCEFDLDTNPSCSSYTSLGTVCGDMESSSLSTSDRGEKWFRIYVSECNGEANACIYLSTTIVLQSPAGMDYDLEAYCDSCGTIADSSRNDIGETDSVDVSWEEESIMMGIPTGSDSGRYVYIRVVFASGNSCDDYTLTVYGNTPSPGFCCSKL